MPLRYRDSIGSPIQDEFYQEQISIKNDHQNETTMTVQFVCKISTAVNKTNEAEELECNELYITTYLDLQKENPAKSINVKSNQSSIINRANDDISAFGDDEVPVSLKLNVALIAALKQLVNLFQRNNHRINF